MGKHTLSSMFLKIVQKNTGIFCIKVPNTGSSTLVGMTTHLDAKVSKRQGFPVDKHNS